MRPCGARCCSIFTAICSRTSSGSITTSIIIRTSLAEIAASSGISRQGVWDNIRRADAALRDTEARLGLVRRFAAQRAAAAALEDTLTKLRDTVGGDARLLAERALRQLQDLKG